MALTLNLTGLLLNYKMFHINSVYVNAFSDISFGWVKGGDTGFPFNYSTEKLVGLL